MIKTVPFDIPASFLVGMLIPLACPKGIRAAGSPLASRYFLGAVLFELFFFMPLGAYLYYFFPDWSLMYFMDPAGYDLATFQLIGLVALCGYLAAAVAGFALGAGLVRAGREAVARTVFIAVLAGLLVFSAVTYRQLLGVGLYVDWVNSPRTTVPIFGHRIGFIIGIDAAVAGAALMMMLQGLRHGESVDA